MNLHTHALTSIECGYYILWFYMNVIADSCPNLGVGLGILPIEKLIQEKALYAYCINSTVRKVEDYLSCQ